MDAGLYLRMSQDRKEEDPDTGEQKPTLLGIARQEQDCRALATQLGWDVAEVYPDNDVSASGSKPRPQYDRMLADIVAGRIGAIIAWHTDRLYRRPLDLEELIPVCEKHRILIRTVRSGELDLSTPTGRLIGRMLAASARHEVEHKADRWMRSVAQNRQAGKWSNARDRLFGYRRDGIPHPDEAPQLRWIADQVLCGRSLSGIARELNELGITTTRGNRWAPSAVRHLLLNPRIAGHATLTPRTARRIKGVRQAVIVGKGSWDPILDPAKWERVCAALHPYRARPPRVAVLTGLIWCHCGTRMHTGVRDKGKYKYRTYLCPSVPPYDTGCGSITVTAGSVEEMVEAYARTRLADPRFRKAVTAQTTTGGRAAELAAELERLHGRRQELELGLLDPSGEPVSAIGRALADIGASIATLQDDLSRLAPVTLPPPDEWPDDVEIRSALIGLAVERVVIHPNLSPGRRFRPERVRIDPVQIS